MDSDVFAVLFVEGFRNLRELILSHCESMTIEDYAFLCSVKRPLEVLSIDGIFTLHNRLAACAHIWTFLFLAIVIFYEWVTFIELTLKNDLRLLSPLKTKSIKKFPVSFFLKSLSKKMLLIIVFVLLLLLFANLVNSCWNLLFRSFSAILWRILARKYWTISSG